MKKCKAAATSKRREADLPLLNSVTTQLYACAYCNFETMTHADIVQHTREKHSLGEAMKSQEEGESNGQEGERASQDEGNEDARFENLINNVQMNQVGVLSITECCMATVTPVVRPVCRYICLLLCVPSTD